MVKSANHFDPYKEPSDILLKKPPTFYSSPYNHMYGHHGDINLYIQRKMQPSQDHKHSYLKDNCRAIYGSHGDLYMHGNHGNYISPSIIKTSPTVSDNSRTRHSWPPHQSTHSHRIRLPPIRDGNIIFGQRYFPNDVNIINYEDAIYQPIKTTIDENPQEKKVRFAATTMCKYNRLPKLGVQSHLVGRRVNVQDNPDVQIPPVIRKFMIRPGTVLPKLELDKELYQKLFGEVKPKRSSQQKTKNAKKHDTQHKVDQLKRRKLKRISEVSIK